jgi:hypothetical protein
MAAGAAHSEADVEAALTAGEECLAACGGMLRARPAAALDVAVPYLHALWKSLVSADEGTTAAFALPSSGGAPGAHARSLRRHAARAAAALVRGGAAALRAAAGGHGVPPGVCAVLEAEAGVLCYLLGSGLRERCLPLLLRALAALTEQHGGTRIVLNEDMACLSGCPALVLPRPRPRPRPWPAPPPRAPGGGG